MATLQTLKDLLASKPEDLLADEEYQMRKDEANEALCETIRDQEQRWGEEKEYDE